MAFIQNFLLFLTLFSSIIIPTTSQTCNSYTFPNTHNINYVTCKDLPFLESSLHWNYHPSTNTIEVAFMKQNAKESSLIAWDININPTSKGMIGSQSLIAIRKSDGSFKAYTSPITSNATLLQEGNLSFPVHSVSGTYMNGSIIIFASLELPYKNVTLVNHVWQEGLVDDDEKFQRTCFVMSRCSHFSNFGFCFGHCGKVMNSRTTLGYVHGSLNTISWGILMPIGVILARYLKSFDGLGPMWFHLHRAFQSLAFFIGIIGFSIGLYMGNHNGVHNTPHKCIGITLMSLAFTQVCIAVCLRPKKDHKYRIFWNIFHYIVGYTTIALAIWNVLKGFDILDANIIWKEIYIGIIVVLAIIALVLEVVTWMLFWKKRAKNSKESVNIIQPVSVP